ncbi:MAG: PAAR domain-containing protein, partial [bacterium]
PLVTGTVPHVGGVVSMGSMTVKINNLPAARQGDIITESGPPNAIAAGCPTVQIGG